MDPACLLTILSFLEAPEVLTVARVEREFFRRVDEMFGIGSALNGNGRGGREDTEGDEELARRMQEEEERKAKGAKANINIDTTATTTHAPNTTANANNNNGGSTYFSKISSKLLTSGRRLSGGGGGGVGPEGNTVGTPASASASASTSISPDDSDVDPPNAAGLASSIADKLTAGELKSIISMTERLRAKESSLKALRLSNEDLLADVQAKEKVNEFLVAKMKEVDSSRKAVEAELGAKANQAMCDAEVISFLDTRVKDLERMLAASEASVREEKRAHEKTRNERTSQIRVLEDMLSFERQSKNGVIEDERRTKTILVKEVKAQRAKNFVLTEEVHSLRREVEILRERVVGGGTGRRSTVTGSY